MIRRLLAAFVLSVLLAMSAPAAQCGGDFSAFIAAMSREAAAAGVSRAVIDNALAGVAPDQAVLAFDRRQRGTFRKSFEYYAATRVTAVRIKRGKEMLQRHAALLSRIERQFGVPGPLIVAIWGLESDYGTGDMGNLPVIRTLATMAHDRRLCGGDRPDAVSAVLLYQIRRRLRRQRPCRSQTQPAGRARLDGQSAEGQR